MTPLGSKMPVPADPRLIEQNPPSLNADTRAFPHAIEPFPADAIFTLGALDPHGAYFPRTEPE